MVCLAVHLSSIFAKVFKDHFAAFHASGKKKCRCSDDRFDGAETANIKASKKGKGAGNQGKLTKAELLGAAVKARLKTMEAKHAARTAKTKADAATAAVSALAARSKADAEAAAKAAAKPPQLVKKKTKAPAAGGRKGGAMRPAASDALCVLERVSERVHINEVWARQPTPLLPTSTTLTVVSLSGAALSAAARASVAARVVLPSALLKDAFAALACAGRAAPSPSPDAANNKELAVRLNLGNYEPVFAFQSTLDQMCTVLAFNDAIQMSHNLFSWVSGLAACSDVLLAQLNFYSGETMPVRTLAGAVRDDMAGRLLGDCVWAMPPVGRLSAATSSPHGAFGGYSVNVHDVCDAGRTAFVTNALLDGGLAELHSRCGTASLPSSVLSSSQSASFTTVSGSEVSLQRAVQSILHVLNTWDASVDRFVMLFNIGNYHWIAGSISFLSRSVVLYDSMGGTSSTKAFILSRLLLFARHAELRQRAVYPDSVVEHFKWRADKEVNRPMQQDNHNCGLFAFGHIWCSIHGVDFESLSVVGDHLRLSLLHFVFEERARASSAAGAEAA